MDRQVLYVSVDGVLQPLAYSQVCRVLIGLSKRGFRYHLLSLERPADLDDSARVEKLRQELADHEVTWTFERYDVSGKALGAAANLWRIGRSMRTILARHPIEIVHARAYHSALLALAMRRTSKHAYVFDARGRWVDERRTAGRWFTRPSIERGARAVERSLYANASAIVVLTQLHADDIVNGSFGPYSGVPIRVITTCADFDEFALTARLERDSRASQAIPAEVAARLKAKLVLGLVGSTNTWYRHEESLQLAREVLARRQDAHLLILTPQREEFGALVARAGLAAERVTIATASHRAMPEWLSRIDWAIQLLNSGVAKRGSMPTKLAEFLASGVRPLHFGCNDEVTDWVARTGSGYVLESLDAPALSAAADFVASASTHDQATLELARERARGHFDLASGLDSYESLLGSLRPGRR